MVRSTDVDENIFFLFSKNPIYGNYIFPNYIKNIVKNTLLPRKLLEKHSILRAMTDIYLAITDKTPTNLTQKQDQISITGTIPTLDMN